MIGEKKYQGGAVYTGELKNGFPEGEGEIIFPNGSRYVGKWKNGIYNGQGSYYSNTGFVYTGEWENGKYSGYGKLCRENGEIHEGMWANNVMEGQGTLIKKADSNIIWDNGTYDIREKFSGVWKDGKKNGSFVHWYLGIPYDEEYMEDKQVLCPVLYETDNSVSTVTGKTIKCWHSNQSSFMIETPSAVLLFDWYRKQLPKIPKEKPLHIFISHIHEDHFNKGILSLAEKIPNIRIYLGYDGSNSNFNQMLKKNSG